MSTRLTDEQFATLLEEADQPLRDYVQDTLLDAYAMQRAALQERRIARMLLVIACAVAVVDVGMRFL